MIGHQENGMVVVRYRESRWLETALFARRILLLECYSSYTSHITKSCILKALNLKQVVGCNLDRSCRKTI